MTKYFNLTLIATFVFAFLSCGSGQESPSFIKGWSSKDFLNYFDNDKDILKFAEEKKLFSPDESDCESEVSIKNHNSLFNKLPLFSKVENEDIMTQILNITSYLYKTLPIIYIDKEIQYSFDYQIDNKNWKTNIEAAKQGKLAALCGNYSAFFKVMFLSSFESEHGKKPQIKIISFNRPDDMIDHTLNLISWQEEGQNFYLFVDAMYGYVFPIKNNQALSIEKLENDSVAEFFKFIDSDDLHQKRFLTNKIWPCNFSPSSEMIYYKTKDESITKYETLGVDKIEYLFQKDETMNDYAVFLKNYLLSVSPSEV